MLRIFEFFMRRGRYGLLRRSCRRGRSAEEEREKRTFPFSSALTWCAVRMLQCDFCFFEKIAEGYGWAAEERDRLNPIPLFFGVTTSGELKN